MQSLFLHPRDLDITAPHLFWAGPPDEALTASLAVLGQTTPALAVLTEGRPILAAGARRAAALRQLRGRTLAALVVDPQAPPEDAPACPEPGEDSLELRLGLYYLASNMGRLVTEPMLVAAARYFAAHGTAETFVRLAGPYLFAPGDRRERLVTRWLDLPPAFDALLADGHVPLGAGELLAGLDAGTLTALLPLLGAMRWSRGTLANALSWLTEAARREGQPPAVLLGRSGALDLATRGLSPNDLAAGVLAALRRLRYPATTTLEARFAALSRKLLQGSRVKLKPSQGFEADAVTVEVTVKKPAELSRAAAELAAMAVSPMLPRLLAVAREEGEEPL